MVLLVIATNDGPPQDTTKTRLATSANPTAAAAVVRLLFIVVNRWSGYRLVVSGT
jgi:hypothetical protein